MGQEPTDRPAPNDVQTLRRLLGSAEDLLDQGMMLPDFEGKAFFDMACYRAGKSRSVRLPPPTLPVVWMSPGWTHGQCTLMDDQGRAERDGHRDAEYPTGRLTGRTYPSFSFWADLMRLNGPWVQCCGLDTARDIAQMLESPESRTTCLRALGLLAVQSGEVASVDERETQRQFRRALTRFGRGMPTVTPLMIVAEEGPTSPRNSSPVVNLDGFFEGAGAAK
jgi:hypothetical protein